MSGEPGGKPLLRAAEAGQLAFPGVPARIAARRIYRWAAMGTIPQHLLLRAGRSLYVRAASFRAWLSGEGVRLQQ